MTHRQIFAEIYEENKRYLLACLTVMTIFSVLSFGGGGVARAEAVNASDTAENLGGSLGKALAPVIGTGYFAGIDTSWVMVILSVTSLGAAAGKGLGLAGFERLSGFSFGIFENPRVSFFLLLWYGLPLLLKAFSKTYAVGLTLENTLKKLNGVVIIVISSSQVLANVAPQAVAEAASAQSVLTAGAMHGSAELIGSSGLLGKAFLQQGLNSLICLGVLTVTFLLYFLMRYFFAMLDILAVPACLLVPFVSLFLGFGKLVLIVVAFLLAMFSPKLFIVFWALTVILAALSFRQAYIISRYFNNIYAKPLIRRLFGGYKMDYPLIAKRMPAKVRMLLEGANLELAIPVYLHRKIPGAKAMHRFDRWWLVASGGQALLLKPMFGKKDCWRIPLTNMPDRKVFINEFRFFFEIFTVYGPETNLTNKFRKVPKQYHMVFSKEYFHRYSEIRRITGYIDFAKYRDALRKNKPQAPPAEGWRTKMKY